MFHKALAHLLALMFAAAICVPAHAETIAGFKGERDRDVMLIITRDNGDFLVRTRDDGYFLNIAEQGHWIEAGPGGPRGITAEARAHQQLADWSSGRIISSSSSNDTLSADFRPAEDVEIAGYSGTRYENDAGWVPIVLTDDPALFSLGRAYGIYRQAIDMGDPEARRKPTNYNDLLASHGILSVAGRDLEMIREEELPADIFALPSDPLTLDMVLAAEADAPPEREGVYNPVLGGIYAGNALWTRHRDGTLMRWDNGAEVGEAQDIGGTISDFCSLGGEILAVIGHGRSSSRMQLMRHADGEWVQEMRFRVNEQNPFFSLDCSGAEPLLLTAKALILPRSDREIEIDTQILAPGPYFVTLQHDGWLYVGSNAGEWGGGLRRISLADGSGEIIAHEDGALCGGMLNTSCDPVTGLALDPARPDCVLASVGLVHMMASGGHVVRVCDGEVSLAYRKPITLSTNWQWNPQDQDMSGFSSVPFYALSGSAAAAIAVAGDGTYRFTPASETPEFTPFGRLAYWPASGIDWSNPDVVLVATTMNAAHSVSGSSLLVIPRH